MKKPGLILVVLLSLAAISVFFFGASMMGQEAVDALLLFARIEYTVTRIFLWNADTGEERPLTDLTGWGDAGWSPDGRFVWVVDTVDEERSRLRLFDAISGGESTISENLLGIENCSPELSLSPDGEHYAYFTGTETDTSMMVASIPDENLYTLPDVSKQDLSWSPDGTYMLIKGGSAWRLLQTANGSELLTVDLRYHGETIFSPDSRFLAYSDEDLISVYEIATSETVHLESAGKIDGWSPTSRYLLIRSDSVAISPSFAIYDTQTGEEHPLDLGYPLSFAAWIADETTLLFYANYHEYEPQTLLAYELATGEVTTILETTGWIGGIYPRGDWLAIRYSPSAPDPNPFNGATDQLLIRNSETRIEAELSLDWDGSRYTTAPNHTWSPDGRWLGLSSDGLYLFDTEAGNLERLPIDTENPHSLFWSPDPR